IRNSNLSCLLTWFQDGGLLPVGCGKRRRLRSGAEHVDHRGRDGDGLARAHRRRLLRHQGARRRRARQVRHVRRRRPQLAHQVLPQRRHRRDLRVGLRLRLPHRQVLRPAKTKGAAATVKARCKLTLLLDGRDGRAALPPPPPFTKSCELRTFSSGKGGSDQWGHKKFVRRKELEDPSKRLLRHDRFSVRCDVTVAVGIRTDDTTAKLPPPSDLHRHLGRLLKTNAGADVTFDVAGHKFAAHRCVLAARSPVFMAELLGPMKEEDTESHVVAIRDMDARAFKAMLHFIYTDSLPNVDDGGEAAAMAQHLLAAADRYDIERLKLICEDKLSGGVDATTAATTLALAEQHGCCRLKEACLRFMASPANLKAAMASDGFEHLAKLPFSPQRISC
ncbi:BTB/POZ and MATH domain-containing protein 1-like, partial [Oryza sativa Japonica Group]